MEHDRVPKGDLSDGVLAHPPHREGAVPLPVRHRGAGLLQGHPQLIELRRAHPDVAPRVAGGELAHRHLGDEPSLADDHELVGGLGHLAHQVARDEDGTTLGGQAAQELADPADAVGVEPVDRLVEHQHAGVAQQRGGDAETLAHAEGELAGPLPGHRGEADQAEHLVDPPPRDVVRLGQHPQVGVGGPARMDGLGLEEGSHFAQRPGQAVVGAAVDGDRPGVGSVQPHDHPHGRRLACPVRSEEAGDLTGLDVEAQPVDGHLLPEALGQLGRPDGVRRSCGRGRAAGAGRIDRRHCREAADPPVRVPPVAQTAPVSTGGAALWAERRCARERRTSRKTPTTTAATMTTRMRILRPWWPWEPPRRCEPPRATRRLPITTAGCCPRRPPRSGRSTTPG